MVSIMLSLVLFTSSYADIYWQEDFEAPTNLDNWVQSAGTTPDVSTDLAFHGTQSLKAIYTGLATPGGKAMTRAHTNVEEVYTRFYYRTAAFTYNETKHFRQDNLNTPYFYPNFWTKNFGSSREMGLAGQAVAELCTPDTGFGLYDSCNYLPNRAVVPLNDNQWYCIETHLKMNTPSVANGVIEMWVDGVQTLSYTGRTFRGPNVSNPNGNSSLTTFGGISIYVQNGTGLMYYDYFAVGSTRIGCSGSTLPGPTGLTVR